MVDMRVLHSVTTELCTGFLVLAGTAVVVKIVSDFWLRRFRGRVARLDRWALGASRFAEPASYFALVAGVIATFVSIVTGSLAWPADQLVSSTTAHNKILTTLSSQTVFLGAVLLRARYGFRIWMTRSTAALFAILVLTGVGLITLQNSVAGHLAGKGSILDQVLHALSIDVSPVWAFPVWASVGILVGFPLLAALVGLGLRARDRKNRVAATTG